MEPNVNDRSQRVLSALVREFIASGEPVASSVLVTAAGLGVSSATVRNIVARLEEAGYVQQPHTSAGRIPTDRGYRFYVNQLLESKPPRRAAEAVEARLRRDTGGPLLDSVLSHVSHLLSETSRHIGFALRPAHEAAVFHRIEFVPLSATRVLVVIVARGGHVLQKVIETVESLSADDLRQASNFLNAEFAGLSLANARDRVVEQLREERVLYDALLARALRLATSSFEELPDDRALFIEGAASMLDAAEGLATGALQMLLQMIEEKQKLVLLLDRYIDGPGLTVIIGAEHPDPTLRSFSLVASTYDDGTATGTVGVIGPTRMRYSRAITVVHGAAQAVSRMLRDPS